MRETVRPNIKNAPPLPSLEEVDGRTIPFEQLAILAKENPAGLAQRLLSQSLQEGKLESSIGNCHLHGIDSFTLFDRRAQNDGMIRTFYAHPGSLEMLLKETGDFTIGIHNHRFPAVFIPIKGTLVNVRTELAGAHGNKDEAVSESVQLSRFRFQSQLLTGQMSADRIGSVYVNPLRDVKLTPGTVDTMAGNDLHTVRIEDADKTNGVAWIIIEGPEIKNQASEVYSPREHIDLSSEGLYTPISKEQAQAEVSDLLAQLKAQGR